MNTEGNIEDIPREARDMWSPALQNGELGDSFNFTDKC